MVLKIIATLFILLVGFGFIVFVGTPHKPMFLPPDIPYTYTYGWVEIIIQWLILLVVIFQLWAIWKKRKAVN